jgi:hypothetical protein
LRASQAIRSTFIRLRFSAAQTIFHSCWTLLSPRRLNCRNPRTLLIQPLGGSAIHFAFAIGFASRVGLQLGGHGRCVWILLGVELQLLLALAAKSHDQFRRTACVALEDGLRTIPPLGQRLCGGPGRDWLAPHRRQRVS